MTNGQSWQGLISGTVSMAYDPDFRQTSETVNNDSVTFAYDAAGWLVQAGALSLTRNPQNGLLTSTSLNTITDTWQYNGYGEPAGYQAAHNGSAMFEASYVRDDVGRIMQKTEIVNGDPLTTTYTYDASGRLVSVSENDITIAEYQYDLNGNRLAYTNTIGTAITATYDVQDRLVQYGDNRYEYTAAGELQAKIDSSANLTTTYNYDALGNLITVTLPNNTQIEYLIDGQNRHIGKLVDGLLVQGFLYRDQLNPVAELDGSGQVVSRFIYGSKAHVPDYMVKNGVIYRILTDHLGSPRLIVNATTGQVMQEMTYDAFGNVLTDTNPGFQPFGFAGGLYDLHTKLTRFGTRDYDAETGRWTTKDPLGFGGGDSNLYAYAMNDPVNFIDPTGEFAWLVFGGLVGAGFDLGIQLLMNGGDWSQVDWLSVGLSGLAGVLGVGWGSIAARATSMAVRVALNIGGSAMIGGGLTYFGNWRRGECDLGKNVIEAAVLSGLLSGIGTYAREELSKLGRTISKEIEWLRWWGKTFGQRAKEGGRTEGSRLSRIFQAFANSVSVTVSNAGPGLIPWLDRYDYFRPLEPGCACR